MTTINVRCQKCKEMTEKPTDSNLTEAEKAYFCERCDKNTGEVIESEEVNRVSRDK